MKRLQECCENAARKLQEHYKNSVPRKFHQERYVYEIASPNASSNADAKHTRDQNAIIENAMMNVMREPSRTLIFEDTRTLYVVPTS